MKVRKFFLFFCFDHDVLTSEIKGLYRANGDASRSYQIFLPGASPSSAGAIDH